MKKISIILIITFICTLLFANNSNNYFRENFNSLSLWKPMNFPKIKRHSKYSIAVQNGKKVLKAESNASASGLIYKKTFNVYTGNMAKWSWKVSNLYTKGNGKIKKGDDYPIRIYIIFKYNPKKASLFEKVKYNAAKLIYGEYPPHSSLSYVWANKNHKERIITSPYTDRAKMIILEKGPGKVGKWVEERVDFLSDYRKAFKKAPPAVASIAVMSDSDNTGESAVAYVDYIEVYGKKK